MIIVRYPGGFVAEYIEACTSPSYRYRATIFPYGSIFAERVMYHDDMLELRALVMEYTTCRKKGASVQFCKRAIKYPAEREEHYDGAQGHTVHRGGAHGKSRPGADSH